MRQLHSRQNTLLPTGLAAPSPDFEGVDLYLNIAGRFLRDIGIAERYARTARNSEHQRNRVSGKVPRKRKPQIVTPREGIDRLITRAEKRIGTAKHGWAMCARQLVGTRGIPSWVTRKKGRGKIAGSVSERPSAGGLTIEMHNRVPYVGQLMSASEVRQSLTREQKVVEDLLLRAVRARGK